MVIQRRTFFSFHYQRDAWRAGQVRNIRGIGGNDLVNDNDWEQITRRGDAAIRRWIDSQMDRRSCVIVLIGTQTARRKWVEYEIKRAWDDGRGLLGVFIHNLKNREGRQSPKGTNPFYHFTVGGRKLSTIAPVYDPPYTQSKRVYDCISLNLLDWVENAIAIRKTYR